jgi:hypothetical protein
MSCIVPHAINYLSGILPNEQLLGMSRMGMHKLLMLIMITIEKIVLLLMMSLTILKSLEILISHMNSCFRFKSNDIWSMMITTPDRPHINLWVETLEIETHYMHSVSDSIIWSCLIQFLYQQLLTMMKHSLFTSLEKFITLFISTNDFNIWKQSSMTYHWYSSDINHIVVFCVYLFSSSQQFCDIRPI